MRLRNVSGRISRFGGKISKESGKVLGRIEKGAKEADRLAMKGIAGAEKAADSKVVKGLQQGLGIGGRLLATTGVPQLQAAGGALLAGQQGLKEARKGVKKGAEAARGGMDYIRKGEKSLTGAVPRAGEVVGDKNTLERSKSAKEGNGMMYMS